MFGWFEISLWKNNPLSKTVYPNWPAILRMVNLDFQVALINAISHGRRIDLLRKDFPLYFTSREQPFRIPLSLIFVLAKQHYQLCGLRGEALDNLSQADLVEAILAYRLPIKLIVIYKDGGQMACIRQSWLFDSLVDKSCKAGHQISWGWGKAVIGKIFLNGLPTSTKILLPELIPQITDLVLLEGMKIDMDR